MKNYTLTNTVWTGTSEADSFIKPLLDGFSSGVPVHKGITIVLSLFRSHWLAVVYCLVFCIGSCEPVHKDRTFGGVHMGESYVNYRIQFSFQHNIFILSHRSFH